MEEIFGWKITVEPLRKSRYPGGHGEDGLPVRQQCTTALDAMGTFSPENWLTYLLPPSCALSSVFQQPARNSSLNGDSR
jgi:hypothetical protein